MTKEKPIKILILGPPEIYINEKPAIIKRRLNRAILFYLAAQQQPVSRDELCALFWPEETEENARKNLRESLSRIRTGLGVNNLWIKNGEQISLNRDLVNVDFIEMDGLITPLLSSSEMNGDFSLPDWMVVQLKTGMDLSRSTRLMQGLYLPDAKGFENWLEYNNQVYNSSLYKVYDRLIDHYISLGNLEEALVWLGRVFELNPFDENNNYLTLICMRDTGRNQELINFVDYLQNLYQQQQETFPEKFTDIKKAAFQGKNKPVIPGSAWPITESGEPTFIGREIELETLNKALRKRGILLLEGEAGIGKTRLLKQFFTQQPFPPRLFYVRGHPLATRVAFYAIIFALRYQVLEEEWQQLIPQDIERLFSFYEKTLQGLDGPGIPQIGSEWLPVMEDVFFSFMHLLEIAATRRPLLFILDDTTYFDAASISIISFLIDHGFFEKHGLLVVVVSPEVVNQPLNLMLQRVLRERKLERIKLEPFSQDEITRFVQAAVGRLPETETQAVMRHLSGGNPYYLTECVRAAKWSIHGEKVAFKMEHCSPPDTIVAMINDKLNGLEPESVLMIQSAAILGSKFCSDVLEEMTGFDSGQIAIGLDELLREGFLKVNNAINPLGGYAFLHDVEREVLLRRISPAQRRELHLKAAMALEKRRKGLPRFSAALAQHYEISLQHSEALNAWLEAGAYARAQYLLAETHQIYDKALTLIKHMPGFFGEAKILRVVNEWGNFAHDRNDNETGRKIYQSCLEIGNEINSLLLIGAAHSGLGRVSDFEFDYETAENSFQRALFFLSGEEHTQERVKALSRMGILQFSMDDYLQANHLLEEALRLDPGGKDPDSLENRVNILTYLCFLDIFMGYPLKAGEKANEMARLSILVNRKSARVQAHGLLAMTQYFNSQVKLALHTCQEYQTMAEKLGVRYWLSLLDNVASLAHLYTGNLDQSWTSADQIDRREKNFPLEKLYTQAIKMKGDIFRSLEDYPRAKGYYLQLQQSDLKSYQTIGSQQAVASIMVKEGNTTEADLLLDATINVARSKGLAGLELNARLARLMQNRQSLSVELFEQEGEAIFTEMKRRDILDAKIAEYLVVGYAAELRGDIDKAINVNAEMEEYLIGTGNVWTEFNTLKRGIKLSRSVNQEPDSAVARVKDLLVILEKNATHPAIKGSFIQFRNKWKRFVNDVSTGRLYKHKRK